MLLGRKRELGTIAAACRAAAEGRGSVLVVTGEPGIGKTALLDAATGDDPGWRVLRATGVEAESTVAFATIQGLLWPLRDGIDELEGGQARLLRGVLDLGPPGGATSFAVGAATLALLSLASRDEPIVAIVDDAHWADVASQEALCFVGRRLANERVALLAGVRDDEPCLLADERSFSRLALRALDADAARALLEQSSPTALGPKVTDLLLGACSGSPLGLVELPRFLTEGQRSGQEPLPTALEAGPLVQRAFAARASSLDPTARRALLLLAAAGEVEPTLLAQVGASPETLDAVEASGLVARRGGVLVFRHPLVQSAIYGTAAPGERREAHRTLADATRGVRRAWHLAGAAAGPDESVAAALEDAGADARLAGGFAAQAQALERAAELTPDHGPRAERLLDAALAWKRAGRMDHAETLLQAGLALSPDAPTRARIELERGSMLIGRFEEDAAYDLLLAEADRVAAVAPKIAAQILDFAQLAAVMRGDPRDALALAERAAALAGTDADRAELEAVNALHSARMLFPTPPDDTDLRLVRRAAELLEQLELRTGYDDAPWVAYCLALHERDDEARYLSDVVLAEARAAGDVWMLSYGLFARAALEQATGRLDTAGASAIEGLAIAEELGEPWRASEAHWILAEVESARGNVDDCRREIELLRKSSPWNTSRAIGVALLAVGRFDDAIGPLETAASCLEQGVARAWHHQIPLELAEAYACAGRSKEAQSLLRAAAPGIESCRLRRPKAKLGRVRALLASEAMLDRAFTEPLTLLDEAPHHLERARVELCWGERLRGTGRSTDAVPHLEHALARFEALAADGWAARTRVELEAATGARRPTQPRRTDVLTGQELRVSQHAAAGLRDREIAALLYLSPRTVESYLHSAYRKLGVSNRTQLAGVLAGDSIRPLGSVSEPVPQVP